MGPRKVAHILPPKDIDWNWDPAVFLDNPANDGDTHANLEATDAVTFNPAFAYPYGHPGDSNRMHPVSNKCLIVNQSINLSCRVTGRHLNLAHTNHDVLKKDANTITKGYMGMGLSGRPKDFAAMNELGELCDVEDGPIENLEIYDFESRGTDSGHESLQVLADTSEHERRKARKDSAS
jgi:hypothetical protein